ncbi:class I SAM-dependent methyltransferase [Candidatus Latescibacterota bacterium]
MNNYRTRIYEKYSSVFQNSKPVFDENAAIQAGKGYEYYLRDWLPEKKGASIADLGCGSGKLLHYLKCQSYTNITGVDISSEQVHIASKAIPNVIEASVLDFLNTQDEMFDLLTGFDIIEHFNKEEVLAFLDRCYTALKPKGRLILQTPNAESPFVPSVRYGDFSHEVCFTPGSLIHLLKLCGFVDIEVREVGPIPLNYSLKSTVRYGLWQTIRLLLKSYNLIESGSSGAGIYSRVFSVSGVKK